MLQENVISHHVIGLAMKIHSALGPGLLESAYRECLYYDIRESGLLVAKELPLPIIYKNVHLDHGYRIDLLVENKVVIELKAVDSLQEVHFAQVLTYLKLGHYKLGLLINFNSLSLKNGIKRIVNGL
ncbi:MAG: GxxExxY protein [Bacteroidales bacterium]|nr:GxxExxY protein [Bacteroidales bacterium]